jgi:hypothetical protein
MDLNQADGFFPAGFSSHPDPQPENQLSGGRETKNHMNSLIQLKRATPILLILLGLVWLCLLPRAQAVSPAPDGGYPNNNTAEGNDALFSLTTGANNTANGADALFSNTIGLDNTATGAFALLENTSGVNNTANGTGALLENTSGFDNTATGSVALFNNTAGALNTAAGAFAPFFQHHRQPKYCHRF